MYYYVFLQLAYMYAITVVILYGSAVVSWNGFWMIKGVPVSCTDVGVDSSAVRASGPSRKRPRLDLEEEEEEELFEGGSSMITEDPHDVTHDPLHSLTSTPSADVT